eukprot:TRINITY_DN16924_c0_g1_i1.p1 TRINITY_DN16924_c0_g1~~TRINITY_DN16924_c0_g1_i1.p1  ORF type:complete len:660 (-),score=230.33 TRINITY_DN16924_c0_g1_i1:169-2148(-)
MTISKLALFAFSVAAGIKYDASDAATRPVTKVVKLLKGMQSSMEREAKEDEETYEKMTCWCNTNKDEKGNSIKEARESIKSLTARVAELSATGSRLDVEITNLKEEISKNEKGLDSAMAFRKKEASEFVSEEQDLVSSATSVHNAIQTISSSGGSFLQTPHGQVLSQLKMVVQQHKNLLTDAQRKQLQDLLDSSSNLRSSLAQKSSPVDTAGGVAGVLSGLKDDFTDRLESLRSEENRSKATYEALYQAKRDEINAGRTQLEAKTELKANAQLEMVEAKHDIKDTKASLAADSELAAEVKDRCGGMDAEFGKRSKMRNEEMEAVAKAIEILSADEAHDAFGKTFGTSLLQVPSVDGQRKKAAALLVQAGKKDMRLVTLSMMLKLDTFEKVKKAIDDMVRDLKKQQSDEGKKKDWCIDELNKNKLQTEGKSREQESLTGELETLKSSDAKIADEMKVLKDEVAEMGKQITLAGQNREKENSEFQQTVADQRAAQQQLKKALVVLKDFYSKSSESLVQASEGGSPAFKAFKQSSGSVGVLSMLQQLVADAKAMEAEATHAEQTAQKDYEAFAKSTKAAIKAKNSALLDKTEKKGQIEGAVVAARESQEGVRDELKELAQKEADVHGSCDSLMQNFETRQSSREDEVEALQQAKAMLSGAKA